MYSKKKLQVHASRLYFKNTSTYVPWDHVQKTYRQHWTGLELDSSIVKMDQDTQVNITAAVRWNRFPADDLEVLPSENVLDGAHVSLVELL